MQVINCLLVKTRPFYFSTLSFLILCCFACETEETLSLSYSIVQSQQDFAITKIHFFDGDNGVAMGGDNYQFGIAQSTVDGGDTWTIDTVSQKIVRDFDVSNDSIFGVGIDNYITRKQGALAWEELRISDYSDSRGLLKTLDGYILVGGDAFQNGFLIILGNDLVVESMTELEGEIFAIDQSAENLMHIVGFGVIYRSTDKGQTWVVNKQIGDDYRDVFFIDERTGWVVGQAGSILQSNDGGLSWDTQRAPTVQNKLQFNAIHFANELDGMAVGNDGLVFLTKDGGENWLALVDLPNEDFDSVFVGDDIAWLGSDQGHIIKVLLAQ